LTSIHGKCVDNIIKIEMLSCRTFHPLSALLEVFFDLSNTNSVAMRLKAIMFSIKSMALFSCLEAYSVRHNNPIFKGELAFERFYQCLYFVFTLLLTHMQGNCVAKRFKFCVSLNLRFKSRSDQKLFVA
jgi:hypothetical protein